jgi:hypothetical protein
VIGAGLVVAALAAAVGILERAPAPAEAAEPASAPEPDAEPAYSEAA